MKNLAKMRTEAQMLNDLERGVGSPSDALELCKLYRAAVNTMRAQKEVIESHVRTIVELKKKP